MADAFVVDSNSLGAARAPDRCWRRLRGAESFAINPARHVLLDFAFGVGSGGDCGGGGGFSRVFSRIIPDEEGIGRRKRDPFLDPLGLLAKSEVDSLESCTDNVGGPAVWPSDATVQLGNVLLGDRLIVCNCTIRVFAAL